MHTQLIIAAYGPCPFPINLSAPSDRLALRSAFDEGGSYQSDSSDHKLRSVKPSPAQSRLVQPNPTTLPHTRSIKSISSMQSIHQLQPTRSKIPFFKAFQTFSKIDGSTRIAFSKPITSFTLNRNSKFIIQKSKFRSPCHYHSSDLTFQQFNDSTTSTQ